MIRLSNPVQGAILKKWPDGNIYQLYGENPQWYGGKGHPGLDIAKGRGTFVLATHDGTVQSVVPESELNKYGNFVTVLSPKHGTEQVLTQYAHLLDWAVIEGQGVSAGQVLGREGNSGYVISGGSAYWGNAPANLGNHTHFNVFYFINGVLQTGLNGMNTVDPLPFLTGGQENMRYIIDAQNDQYILYEDLKIALSIGDEAELAKLKANGLTGSPTLEQVPLGYLVYPAVDRVRLIEQVSQLKGLFNV